MKNKILRSSVIVLMLVSCPTAFPQIKSEAVLVSISPAEKVSNLDAPRKFRIRIENKTAGTIRLWSRNVTLGITPVDPDDKKSEFVQSYFTFLETGKDKIKGGETIEIEARLDELHWYSSRASAYVVSKTPNLAEIGRIFPGTYHLVAATDITAKKQEKAVTFYRSQSESVDINPVK